MSAPDDPTTAAAPPTPEQLAEIQAFLNSQRIPFYLPFLVGSFLDALFLGLLLVVFAHWLPNVRPTDRKWVQALVWYEMAVSITVSAIVMNHTFLILVPSFGDFQAILTPHGLNAISTLFVLGRIPAVCYFLHRAWILWQRPMWLPMIIAPLLLASLAAGFVTTHVWTTIPPPPLVDHLTLVFSICEVVSDIIITSMLALGLIKSKTGWQSTDRVVQTLIRLLLETQTWPSIAALAFLITSQVSSGPTVGYFLFMPKVYALCLLLVVNARLRIGEQLKGHVSTAPTKLSRSGGTSATESGGSGLGSKNTFLYSQGSTAKPEFAPHLGSVDRPMQYDSSSTALVLA